MTRNLVAVLLPLLACAAPGVHTPPPLPVPTDEVAAQTPADRAPPDDSAVFGVQVHGHGPDVVLIPGLTCGGHVWDETVAHLQRAHTVHVVTLSGFAGRPRTTQGPFLPAVRDALAAYLGGLDRPVVIGHSLGGFMALWLASSEPNLLTGAIAVDGLPALGALSGYDDAQVHAFAERMEATMAAQSPEAFAEQTAQTLLFQIADPQQAAAVAMVSGRSDPSTVGQAMAELLKADLRPQMGSVRAPVLLLGAAAGTPQQLQERESAYRAQLAEIPHHEVVMVPGTRHFVMLDAPDAFEAHVDRFLEAVQ